MKSEQHKNPRRQYLKSRNILSFNKERKYFNTTTMYKTKMVLAGEKCSKHVICFSLQKVKISQIYINKSLEYSRTGRAAQCITATVLNLIPGAHKPPKLYDPRKHRKLRYSKVFPFKAGPTTPPCSGIPSQVPGITPGWGGATPQRPWAHNQHLPSKTQPIEAAESNI